MATITRYSCETCGAWYETQSDATACANKRRPNNRKPPSDNGSKSI